MTARNAQVLALDDLKVELASVPGARPVGILALEIGRGVLPRLPDLVAAYLDPSRLATVAVLTDGVAMTYAGVDLCRAVVGMLSRDAHVRTVVALSHDGRVHADQATLHDAVTKVAGASVLVTVGSGTMADVGKAVSAQLDGLPHVLVQTALSVNGFADDQSVLLRDGVKRTTATRWPEVLIADTDVLAGAPADLNAAGVGDLMAMFTAPADWRLARMLHMSDEYSEQLVAMVRRNGQELLAVAPLLWQREPQAIELVARVLTLSGISMGAAGTTAPSSGAEHTVSHLIEMAMNSHGSRSALHGAQVGVCSVLAAVIWKRVRQQLTATSVQPEFPAEAQMESRVSAAFHQLDPGGAMGAECWRLYRHKLARWHANRFLILSTNWVAVDRAVSAVLAEPEALVAALSGARAPTSFCDLDPPVDTTTVRWALTNCHFLRDRFTIVDLAFFLGVWEQDDIDQVLAETERLGKGLCP